MPEDEIILEEIVDKEDRFEKPKEKKGPSKKNILLILIVIGILLLGIGIFFYLSKGPDKKPVAPPCTEDYHCPAGKICKDGKCMDKPRPVEGYCGDGACSTGESYETCPGDCPEQVRVICGDGICKEPENYETCPSDCVQPGKPIIEKPVEGYCGDGICSAGENYETCPRDCITDESLEGDWEKEFNMSKEEAKEKLNETKEIYDDYMKDMNKTCPYDSLNDIKSNARIDDTSAGADPDFVKEIYSEMLDRSESINTYKIERIAGIDFNGNFMVQMLSIKMDKRNKKREEIAEMCVTGGTGVTATKFYYSGNTLYIGTYGSWMKKTSEYYEDIWETYLDEDMNMQYSTKVKLLGNGTAYGKGCWVIKEESDFPEMVNEGYSGAEGLNMSKSELLKIANAIDIETKIWIEKETYYPIVVESITKTEGMEKKEVTKASGFNEPLSIEMPEEANNAAEYSETM